MELSTSTGVPPLGIGRYSQNVVVGMSWKGQKPVACLVAGSNGFDVLASKCYFNSKLTNGAKMDRSRVSLRAQYKDADVVN